MCSFAKVVLGIPADGTSTATPFLETRAMKHVLAEDGEEAGRFVHAFKADGTGWELDQGGCRGCFGFCAPGRRGQRWHLDGGIRVARTLKLLGWCKGVVGHVWERGVLAGYLNGTELDRFDEDDMAILSLVVGSHSVSIDMLPRN